MIPLIIEQRWSSHNRAAIAVKNNYPLLCDALDIASEAPTIESKDRLLAGGLLRKINKPVFKFLIGFIADLLSEIEPVNKMLQGREISYTAAVPLINNCVEKINGFRCDEEFLKYREAGEQLNIDFEYEEPRQVRIFCVLGFFCIIFKLCVCIFMHDFRAVIYHKAHGFHNSL